MPPICHADLTTPRQINSRISNRTRWKVSVSMSRSLCLACVALVMSLSTWSPAADPLAWIPSDVNAVARINVAEIYKTPLAKKEGWLKQATESFIQQEAFIPPGTTQIFLAANLDLSNNLASHGKYAVLVPEAQL